MLPWRRRARATRAVASRWLPRRCAASPSGHRRPPRTSRICITNSSAQVQEGVELVNRAGASLTEIVDSIKKVAEIVSDIALASGEQSSRYRPGQHRALADGRGDATEFGAGGAERGVGEGAGAAVPGNGPAGQLLPDRRCAHRPRRVAGGRRSSDPVAQAERRRSAAPAKQRAASYVMFTASAFHQRLAGPPARRRARFRASVTSAFTASAREA